MTLAQRTGTLCIGLLLAMPTNLWAGTLTPEQAARQSVQSFYDWYTTRTHDNRDVPLWTVAVKQRRRSFSTQLAHALAADATAQAGTKGDVNGLDFDPFLNTQDPAEHYEAHAARCEGEVCSVPVFAGNSTTGNAAVTAEVTRRAGQWRFTNFQYAEGRNLLQVLRALQTERTRR